MIEGNIVYEKQELYDISAGVRICIGEMMEGNRTPYSLFLDCQKYFDYISQYKCDIIRFLPINYLGFKHKHRDTYLHYATEERLQQIVKEGVLRMDLSDDICSVGKAVYTYPLNSGMFFVGRRESGSILLFEAEEEHCHITQTDDTPCCIGEADFYSDVKILNPRIITIEEAEKLSKECFKWETAQKSYYGLDIMEDATYETFMDVVEHYNYDYKPIQTN